jgi:hypothetical protein
MIMRYYSYDEPIWSLTLWTREKGWARCQIEGDAMIFKAAGLRGQSRRMS